jgi:hypothetical protein
MSARKPRQRNGFAREVFMVDIIAALVFGAMFTVDIAVLVGFASIQASTKVKAFAVAGGWAITVMTISAMGGFAPGSIGRFPAPLLAFSLVVATGALGWFLAPGFRNVMVSLPLGAVVGVNAFRIAGVFFLILFEQNRLAAPFGPVAGWGDIITGIAAIPIALVAAYDKPLPSWTLRVWNTFGALDLIVAITLAFLSAAGSPFQVFTDARGTEVLTTGPWIAAATLLVPLYLFSHLTIAAQQRIANCRTAAYAPKSANVELIGSVAKR